MQVINPNGMVQRLNESRKQPRLRERYGRRKDGAPQDAGAIMIAARQDRRSQARETVDSFRGQLFDVKA